MERNVCWRVCNSENLAHVQILIRAALTSTMIDLTGKKTIVTGGAGFIGSNLVDTLLEGGAEVIVIDNLVSGNMKNLERASESKLFKFVEGDVRDSELLDIQFQGVDYVFHEAAFVSVPKSVDEPVECNDVNVNGTITVLESARKANVGRVVFASSAALYGNSPVLPKTEKMMREPVSPYGSSKLAAESYCLSYFDSYGLETVPLRYFNVYGPRQMDSPYSGVIAIFLGLLSEGKAPTIFGNGMQTRDFVFVQDVVQANILAATHPNAPGKIFNVGTGTQVKLKEITQEMIDAFGLTDVEIKYADERQGDIFDSYADISAITTELSYKPSYSLKQGIRKLVDSFNQ